MSTLNALRYVTFMALLALAGCAWLGSTQGKQAEKEVLQASQVFCALEHSLFPVAEIEAACSIDHKLAPLLEQLLAEHRAAAKREQFAAASLDAGVRMPPPWAPGDAGGDALPPVTVIDSGPRAPSRR